MFFELLLLLGCAATSLAKVQLLGVAIAGGDFGCQIDGSCPTGSVQLPLSSLGGGDGLGQMQHFARDNGMNIFRLPTSWQFLTNNKAGSTLDPGNLGKYDQLVQACLGTGAYCMIDIHNFARFNGAIIGQGGPTDDQFVGLWTQLAAKYAGSPKVVFELMNEPHDLDVGIWARTCQKAVTAIRNAGATSHMILLPGTNFDSAATLVSSGSADALMAITNPDGSTDNLLLDIHKYLDADNSGTHAQCVTDNTASFAAVADYLRRRRRLGLVSETGASSDPSCMAAFCAQNTFINANSDVFVGLVAWGAGSFAPSYVLSLTPSRQGGKLVDNALMTRCVVGTWAKSANAPAPPPPSRTSAAAMTPVSGGGATSVVTPSSSVGEIPASSQDSSRVDPPATVGTYTKTLDTGGQTSVQADTLVTAETSSTRIPATSISTVAFGGAAGGQTGSVKYDPSTQASKGSAPIPTSGLTSQAASTGEIGSLLIGSLFAALLL